MDMRALEKTLEQQAKVRSKSGQNAVSYQWLSDMYNKDVSELFELIKAFVGSEKLTNKPHIAAEFLELLCFQIEAKDSEGLPHNDGITLLYSFLISGQLEVFVSILNQLKIAGVDIGTKEFLHSLLRGVVVTDRHTYSPLMLLTRSEEEANVLLSLMDMFMGLFSREGLEDVVFKELLKRIPNPIDPSEYSTPLENLVRHEVGVGILVMLQNSRYVFNSGRKLAEELMRLVDGKPLLAHLHESEHVDADGLIVSWVCRVDGFVYFAGKQNIEALCRILKQVSFQTFGPYQETFFEALMSEIGEGDRAIDQWSGNSEGRELLIHMLDAGFLGVNSKAMLDIQSILTPEKFEEDKLAALAGDAGYVELCAKLLAGDPALVGEGKSFESPKEVMESMVKVFKGKPPVVYLLSEKQKGNTLPVLNMITQHPEVRAYLEPLAKALLKCYQGKCALDLLLEYRAGRVGFEKLFQELPELFLALLTVDPKSLFLFANSPFVAKTFSMLVDSLPDAELESSGLVKALAIQDKTGVTPFVNMTSRPHCLEALCKLMDKAHGLFSDPENADIWMSLLSHRVPSGEYTGFTGLACLSLSEEGAKLFFNIVSFPAMVQEEAVFEGLTRVVEGNPEGWDGYNALQGLIAYDPELEKTPGIDALMVVFRDHLNIAQIEGGAPLKTALMTPFKSLSEGEVTTLSLMLLPKARGLFALLCEQYTNFYAMHKEAFLEATSQHKDGILRVAKAIFSLYRKEVGVGIGHHTLLSCFLETTEYKQWFLRELLKRLKAKYADFVDIDLPYFWDVMIHKPDGTHTVMAYFFRNEEWIGLFNGFVRYAITIRQEFRAKVKEVLMETLPGDAEGRSLLSCWLMNGDGDTISTFLKTNYKSLRLQLQFLGKKILGIEGVATTLEMFMGGGDDRLASIRRSSVALSVDGAPTKRRSFVSIELRSEISGGSLQEGRAMRRYNSSSQLGGGDSHSRLNPFASDEDGIGSEAGASEMSEHILDAQTLEALQAWTRAQAGNGALPEESEGAAASATA